MSHVRRMGYLLILLFAGALLTAMVWKPAPPPVFVGIATDQVPLNLDGYTSAGDYEQPQSVKDQLRSATIISRTYARGSEEPIDFTLIGGTDRTALHDPRSCLIGAGQRLDNDHYEALPGTNVELHSCRVVGRPGTVNYDMIDWYVVDGRIINRQTQIRAAMLMSALLGRKNTPAYFLRFMRPLPAQPGDAAATHAQLEAFAAQMWSVLKPKLAASGNG